MAADIKRLIVGVDGTLNSVLGGIAGHFLSIQIKRQIIVVTGPPIPGEDAVMPLTIIQNQIINAIGFLIATVGGDIAQASIVICSVISRDPLALSSITTL
jgi:hypothetical protein